MAKRFVYIQQSFDPDTGEFVGFYYTPDPAYEGQEPVEVDDDSPASLLAAEEATTGRRSPQRGVFESNTPPVEGLDEPIIPETVLPQQGPEPRQPQRSLVRAQEPRTTEEQIDELLQGVELDPVERQRTPLEQLERATEPVRQAGAGFAGMVAQTPWMLAAGLASPLEGARRAIHGEESRTFNPLLPHPDTVGEFVQAGGTAAATIDRLFGVGRPANPVSRVARAAGQSFIPGHRMATAAITGVNLGADLLRREQPSLETFANAPRWLSQALAPSAAAEEGQFEGPRGDVTQVVETAGGPLRVSVRELSTLGGMVAASLGMIFMPRIFARFRSGAVPRLRTAGENTAPGTQSMSTLVDLARTYDDVNAGALRLMRRAGVDPVAAAQVEEIFRIQTRATTNALTEAAVSVGRMDTPAFTFRVRTPLQQLRGLESEAIRNYIHVLDTIDDIKALSVQQLTQRRPVPGPPVVRGLDLTQASAIRRALEQSNPEVVQWANEYRLNLRALRRFQSTGEYATLPLRGPNSAAALNANNPNTVPFPGPRPLDMPVTRGSPSESLAHFMQQQLRHRMENEAVGMYVDAVRRVQPNLFVRVATSAEEARRLGLPNLERNRNWAQNTVEFYRRGRREVYTADPFLADVLRMDPYYIQGMGQLWYGSKRLMEITTTGELAPWFSVTSLLRNWQIGKITTPQGMRSPTFAGSLYAIPQQLTPQAANWMSQTLNNASAGWLGNVFGQGNVQALATRIGSAYTNSLWAQLEGAGGGRGSIMQQQTHAQAMRRLTQTVQSLSQQPGMREAATILDGYRAMLNAIHNAPSYNFVSRNRGRMNTVRLAAEARHLTGDPRRGGQYYTRTGRGDLAPIRFEGEGSGVGHAMTRAYGWTTEAARTAIPWHNATVQGIKRIGQAYLENPTLFTGRIWLYQVMPAAGLYLWNRSLGTDPNGRSYSDYQMNMTTDYNRTMNHIIGIPGQPVENSIMVPRFHEATLAGRMIEVALDHMLRSNLFPLEDDLKRTAASFAGVTISPPWPPLISGAMGTQGIVAPQGPFEGGAYRPRVDEFDQTGGLPKSLETTIRATTPGIGDIIGQSSAAFLSTPEGVLTGLKNAFQAGGRRMIERTPIVRDITGIRPPVAGTTPITEEIFARNKEIRILENFYKRYTRLQGKIGVMQSRRRADEGALVPAVRSNAGEQSVTEVLGERPPADPAGVQMRPPTNPLYNMFIERLHQSFGTDQEAFQSAWNRYGLATKHLQTLRKINEGNFVTEQDRMTDEQRSYLERNGVNSTNLRQVRNFYERRRQDAARLIMFKIRRVEEELSQEAGQPIKLRDIHPYGRGLQSPETQESGEDYTLPSGG